MTAKKKRTTKHVVGNIFNLIKKWQLDAYDGFSYPLVNGIVFSNEGENGREPLFDASKNKTGDIMAYWKYKEDGILEVTCPNRGYEVKAPKIMSEYFRGTVFYGNGAKNKTISYLDVTHLDVSQSTDFSNCFKNFGQYGGVTVRGLNNWNVKQGINFARMFAESFWGNQVVELDLSTWNFSRMESINMNSMFRNFASNAESVMLNLKGWYLTSVTDFSQMFDNFAQEAETVNISGIEDWSVGQSGSFSYMFLHFAPKSKCQLDLSNWSKEHKLSDWHNDFAKGTFFRIKEPEWMTRKERMEATKNGV